MNMNLNQACHSPQGGMLLIELMIAMVVLGAGLLALGKFQGDLHTSNTLARSRTHALNLSREMIDRLRFQGRNDYSNVISGSDLPVAPPGEYTVFTRSWTVMASGSPAYKTARVTVSWTDHEGQPVSVSQTSMIKEEDLSKLKVFVVPL
ncbi:MAG: prepilin-type N-terminal cleavage/methylation domain-containing protein [Magnetococcales bacterium]|nr:prepilin-type N-terminal cleavage/methylation domain-containing protein [Magnetococcales bacterium]